MSGKRLVIVGPTELDTGGVTQYVNGQSENLSEDTNVRLHNNGLLQGQGILWFVHSLLLSLWQALRFVLQSKPDIHS